MAEAANHWMILTFGLLGNVVSFMVFLAPLPTFYQIFKKKSTQGFQSIPYVVALFSAMLWLYYASLKTGTTLLVTINAVGVFIETIYIAFFLYYASKKARIQTMKVLLLLVVAGFGLIVLLTHFLVKEMSSRAKIVGWVCLVFAFCVFVAPLAIVRQVIKTKSVEYMPFLLSLFLTLSAVMWFFYGLLLKDFNIAIPNVLGFTFGVLQMVLYAVYKDKKKVDNEVQKKSVGEQLEANHIIIVEDDEKLPEQIIDIMKLGALLPSEKAKATTKNTQMMHEDDDHVNVMNVNVPPPQPPVVQAAA